MGRSDCQLHTELTPTQTAILRSKSHHLLISGPAGTGKTWVALVRGLRLLHDKVVDRIIIVRSAVPTRSIGFLPGDEDEKTEAYFGPYAALIDQISPRIKYREMLSKKMLETVSTSFLRGVTWDDAYVICDEYQNLAKHELETTLTRVGEGTQLVLVGDSDQSDLRGNEALEHREVIMTLAAMESVECFEFGIDEIVRSGFVREYFTTKATLERLPI